MTATIISNQTPFGTMTNQMVNRFIQLHGQITRLREAVATASAGYTGVEGTEFETASFGAMPPAPPNNFGVQPDPETPGAKGSDYRYAIDSLATAWDTFWPIARPFLEQLDNGGSAM
jgi:hypothetical protein